MKRKKHRHLMAVVLSTAMVFQLTPANGVLAQSCEHHTEHTADCGYVEAVEGQECSHEHTEECYLTETKCVHEHSAECYPAESETEKQTESTDASAEETGNTESEPTACTHVCSEESGCVVRTLNCTHVHDAACGYVAAVEGSPCAFVCTECSNGNAQSGNSLNGGMTEGNNQDELLTERSPENETQPNNTLPTLSEEVKKVQALIDALPSAEEAGNMNDADRQNVYMQTQEANDAYEALSAEEQVQVDKTKIETLFAYFNSLTMTTGTTSNEQTDDSVAVVNGTYYTDFMEALAATYNNSNNWCKLLKDVTVNGSIGDYSPWFQGFQIDLNDHTLTCSGGITLFGSVRSSNIKGPGTVNANIEVGGGSFYAPLTINGNISQLDVADLSVYGSGTFRVNGNIGDFDLSSNIASGVTIVCTGTCSETDIQDKVITDSCKVDVTWGSMEFTYTEAKTWNPETVSYDVDTVNSGWKPTTADSNKIQVINKGYDPVNVTYGYAPTDTAVTGAFYKDASGTTQIAAPVTVAEIGGTDTAYLLLSGSPADKSGGKATLGSVKVTINSGTGGN